MNQFCYPRVADSAKKTGINYDFLIFVDNCLQYDVMNVFLAWLRTGSNPAEIYQNSKPKIDFSL